MIAATQTATAPHISPAPAERRSIGLVVELAPDAHIRPAQLESQRGSTLVVYDGILCVTVGDDDYVLMPGDSVTLRAGARARAWNAGDDAARVIIERC
jgi:quercetin dioxygenase-like cupin family protein